MSNIESIITACKQSKLSDCVNSISPSIYAIAHEHCKQHFYSEQIVVIISFPWGSPRLVSYSHNFKIEQLNLKVTNLVKKAREGLVADILIIEWLPLKDTAIPYGCFMQR